MEFDGRAYARAGLIGAKGSCIIDVKVKEFKLTLRPKLKKEGNFNVLDYHIDKLKIDVRPSGVKVKKFTIGILPSWFLTPIANIVVDVVLVAF